jgi:colicin import membrane protein
MSAALAAVTDKGTNVDYAQLELQLKVWKDLAISKQVLMRGAAQALKLDPDCTQEELKQALDATLKRIVEAEASVAKTRDETRQSLTAMEQKLTAANLAQAAAQHAANEARTALERSALEMAVERTSSAKELQKLKETVLEKDKAVKAINTALNDTPDNVLKKLKALKKEKQDEADARRVVEAALNTLRKEVREHEATEREAIDKHGKLATQVRNLHALATSLLEQLKPLVADAKTLPNISELEESLLELGKDDDKSGKNPNGAPGNGKGKKK